MSAPTLTQLLVLLCVAAFGTLFTLVMLKHPWWSVVATVGSLPLVPAWIGASVGPFFISAHTVLAAVAVVTLMRNLQGKDSLGTIDAMLGLLVALVTVGHLIGQVSLSGVYGLAQWLVFYVFARLASAIYGLRRIAEVLIVTSAIAAGFMLIEAATQLNIWVRFVRMDNPLYAFWSAPQFRGGVLRAEGAFGHSIAAGCTLAVAGILAVGTTRGVKMRLLTVLVGAGVLVTVSRLGMISLAIGVALIALVGVTDLGRRARIAILSMLAVGGGVFFLTLGGVFTEAGSEATDSAAYRGWLMDLIPSVNLLGSADSLNRSTAGTLTYGSFRSIDSALLLFALTYGALAFAIIALLLASAVIRTALLKSGPATIAVIAQIAALVGVALITQYALVFWLSAGLAVTEVRRAAPVKPPPQQSPSAGPSEPMALTKPPVSSMP